MADKEHLKAAEEELLSATAEYEATEKLGRAHWLKAVKEGSTDQSFLDWATIKFPRFTMMKMKLDNAEGQYNGVLLQIHGHKAEAIIQERRDIAKAKEQEQDRIDGEKMKDPKKIADEELEV
ncbi:hypothetical protein Slin15195_G053550 [Septoria linicola]|uniref:Uncharacterized protein n=1 Tax=Septoria linicola TaxID=215465 RepID=A0A9Q9EHP8_9PEZI|nr:hypothetical protein Slin15195_G053550 [Septoria linicola]